MSNTPSDVEIIMLDAESGVSVRAGKGAVTLARAVLAKWGQPAQAAEPVARLEIGKTKGGVSLTHIAEPAAFQLQEGMYALYTSPQPPQEPLTDEQIRAMLNKHPPEDVCAWSYRMGIDDAELHHGIKGGQHGTDT